jgi:internalin A
MGENYFLCVPQELFVKILGYLDFCELIKLAHTNSTWRSLSYASVTTLGQYQTRLTDYVRHSRNARDGARAVQEIVLRFPNLQILGRSKFIDESLIQKLVHLTSVDLRDCLYDISNDGIKGLVNLTDLHLGCQRKISDASISCLVNLTSLHVGGNGLISEGLTTLPKLTSLNLSHNLVVTDEILMKLSSLTDLNLNMNFLISDMGLQALTNLKCLHLNMNHSTCDKKAGRILNAGLLALTNLRKLELGDNSDITDGVISRLTFLNALDLRFNYYISEAAVRGLTSLTELYLGQSLIGSCVSGLTNLTLLCLEENDQVKDDHLSTLTTLRNLNLYGNGFISDACVKQLTSLTQLNVSYTNITDDGISTLTKLASLVAEGISLSSETLQCLLNLTDFGD